MYQNRTYPVWTIALRKKVQDDPFLLCCLTYVPLSMFSFNATQGDRWNHPALTTRHSSDRRWRRRGSPCRP